MRILLCLLLVGCASTTYRDGNRVFHTSADIASLRIGADGSLTMTGVNHSAPTTAQGKAAGDRLNELMGIIGTAGASMLFH